jgi:hypothetical protein
VRDPSSKFAIQSKLRSHNLRELFWRVTGVPNIPQEPISDRNTGMRDVQDDHLDAFAGVGVVLVVVNALFDLLSDSGLNTYAFLCVIAEELRE